MLVVGGERPTALTEARFDKPLPVALHAEYAVDGDVVAAADVPGAAGEITVTYTLTNTTAEQTELTYPDASGQEQSSEQPVFVPFQGSLTATLPEDAELVEAPDAMLATDEQGRTVARWNVSLFPPISTPIQTLELTMRTERAAVPGAEVLLTPAGTDQDPATGFADELLDGSNSGNGELYEGLSHPRCRRRRHRPGHRRAGHGAGRPRGGCKCRTGASETLAQGSAAWPMAPRPPLMPPTRSPRGWAAWPGAEAAADACTLAQGSAAWRRAPTTSPPGPRSSPGHWAGRRRSPGPRPMRPPQLARATSGTGRRTSSTPLHRRRCADRGRPARGGRRGSARPATPSWTSSRPLPPDGDTTCPPGGTAPPDDDCVTIYQGVRALRDGLAAVDDVAAALEGRVDAAREAIRHPGGPRVDLR